MSNAAANGLSPLQGAQLETRVLNTLLQNLSSGFIRFGLFCSLSLTVQLFVSVHTHASSSSGVYAQADSFVNGRLSPWWQPTRAHFLSLCTLFHVAKAGSLGSVS